MVGSPDIAKWISIMGKKYQEYTNIRIKKEIIWKVIKFEITDSDRKMMKKYPKLTDYRLWPRDIVCNGNFNIVHDTIILHTMVEPFRIIEIRDKDLVVVFKNYFDMMWEKSEAVVL